MANQELLNKQYKLPQDVLNGIRVNLITNPDSDGTKRAKFMLKNGSVTYQVLKRLKNFFDYFNPKTDDKSQYLLAGGELMRNFVETTLNQDRAGVKRSKETKQEQRHMNNMNTTRW